MAEMLEDGRWEEAAALVRRLGLEEGPVKEAFQVSGTWANQLGAPDLEAAESWKAIFLLTTQEDKSIFLVILSISVDQATQGLNL